MICRACKGFGSYKIEASMGSWEQYQSKHNIEVNVEDIRKSMAKKHFIQDSLLQFVDIWKGGCKRNTAY